MAGGISWLRASCVICGILLATLLLSKSSPVRGVVVVTSDGVKAQREFSLRAQPLLRHIGDTAIFDSGVPPQHYQTGGIVWAGQTLGLRFVPKPATRQHLLKAAATTAWAVTSITLYVGADRVHPGEQGITLSLCASSPDTGLPADDCISEPFNMQRVHQVEAEWRPAAAWNFRVRSGEASWFIVQGNATIPEHSFSWLDGSMTSSSSQQGAASAYMDTTSGEWVFDASNSTLPSLRIIASSTASEK